jgi:hypothetical protein
MRIHRERSQINKKRKNEPRENGYERTFTEE